MAKLYLMQATLDMVNLARYAAEQRHSDPDRTAHCLVVESFGRNRMPKPFVIKTRLRDGELKGTLLAYTQLTAQELRNAASQHQKLAHSAVMDPSSINTVGVPDQWSEGQSIHFEVRIRPTKRSSNRDAGHPKSEQDIYLGSEENSNRAETYCRWLTNLIRRQGGLQTTPDTMVMTQFAMRRVRRQNSSQWTTGPDATIVGTAIVVNPDRVKTALTSGLGRHKGYGYGMLLIRPSGA